MYFSTCSNLAELKKAYRLAAMKHHPDHGGSTATMQRINADYETRRKELELHPIRKKSPTYQAGPTAEDWAKEAEELREYELKENARKMERNRFIRRNKAILAEEMAADPLMAELIRMTGNEIIYESKLIEWACLTGRWYSDARDYINARRWTYHSKELHIRWEYGPAPDQEVYQCSKQPQS